MFDKISPGHHKSSFVVAKKVFTLLIIIMRHIHTKKDFIIIIKVCFVW